MRIAVLDDDRKVVRPVRAMPKLNGLEAAADRNIVLQD